MKEKCFQWMMKFCEMPSLTIKIIVSNPLNPGKSRCHREPQARQSVKCCRFVKAAGVSHLWVKAIVSLRNDHMWMLVKDLFMSNLNRMCSVKCKTGKVHV